MLPKLYGKQEKVIEETIKVAVSYVKETVVKLFKLCKKAGFDKIRTPKSFTLHLKKKKKKKFTAKTYLFQFINDPLIYD